MRSGIRSKWEQTLERTVASSVWAENSKTDEEHKRNRHNDEQNLLRIVDTIGEMLVWCRKCYGNIRVKLGRKLLNRCQHIVDESRKNKMLDRIPKLEEGQVREEEGLES